MRQQLRVRVIEPAEPFQGPFGPSLPGPFGPSLPGPLWTFLTRALWTFLTRAPLDLPYQGPFGPSLPSFLLIHPFYLLKHPSGDLARLCSQKAAQVSPGERAHSQATVFKAHDQHVKALETNAKAPAVTT